MKSQLPIHFYPSNKKFKTFITQKLETTLNEFNDSFFVFNYSQILENFCQWQKMYPFVYPYLDISNLNIEVLGHLDLLNLGYVCHSNADLKNLPLYQKVLFDPRLLLSSTIRNIKFNAGCLTFNGIDDYEKIISIYPTAKLIINIDMEELICQKQDFYNRIENLLNFIITEKGKSTLLGFNILWHNSNIGNIMEPERMLNYILPLINNYARSIQNDMAIYFNFASITTFDNTHLEKVSQIMNNFIHTLAQRDIIINFSASINEVLFLNAWSLVTPIINSVISPENKKLTINNSIYDVFMNNLLLDPFDYKDYLDIQPLYIGQKLRSCDKQLYNITGYSDTHEDVIANNFEYAGDIGNCDWLMINYKILSDLSGTFAANFKCHPGIKSLFFAHASDKQSISQMMICKPKNVMPDISQNIKKQKFESLDIDADEDYEFETCLALLFAQEQPTEALNTEFMHLFNYGQDANTAEYDFLKIKF